MGAWGTGAFDNDNAADFAGSLEDCSDDQARQDLLEATLGGLIKNWDRLYSEITTAFESPHEIEEAIAAAAFVADAKNERHEFTNTSYAQMHDPETDAWSQIPLGKPSQHLATLALVAMSCVKTAMEIQGIGEEWIKPIEAILAALDN